MSPLELQIEAADAAINVAYIEAQKELFAAASHQKIGGATALFAGESSPINRVIGFGLTENTNDDLDEIEQWCAQRKIPARIEVCSFATPSSIELLQSRGYQEVYQKGTWSLPLLDATVRRPETSLDVRPVRDGEQELWVETVAKGFAGKENGIEQDASIARPTSRSRVVHCFLALDNGEAIAGASVAIVDTLALLSSMSTRVAHRRRGAQSVLLAERLQLAITSGCEIALAHASPTNVNSQRNIERAGFRFLYNKTVMSKHAA
jgi:GNAT superfamily N-acetyltransferase